MDPNESPVPLPDLDVIAEMQGGILTGLVAVPELKSQGKRVVFGSVLLPQEILRAMDVPTIYGELLGGYASIFGLSGKYCQTAEELGMSRDVCAVHRCMIGAACAEVRDPFFTMTFAEPDLVLGSNFPCLSGSRSFLQIAEHFGCPFHFIDTPINTWGREIPEHAVRYHADELRGMIAFLEQHGFRMDWERLKQEVAFTKRLNAVLAEIEALKRARPTPMKAYDTVIAMTAPLALPTHLRTVEVFERLRDELAARVAQRIGVVEEEKLRLLWIGVPPLCDFKLLNYPERHGAVVAKSMVEFLTGFTLDPAQMDPEHPLESIARAQLASPANPCVQGSVDFFVGATRDYAIDGVVAVVKRSCSQIPAMQRLLKDAIQRETGVPAIIFDLDGVDLREYDAAATKASLDAFVETLLSRKAS